MDEVFRALADPTRRWLLDELFQADGQTLSALGARFDISRFGVMKHLQLLEDAGLVVTRRRGREKLHFLNPVPIRLVHDRWVSKYAQPWVAGLSDLKTRLETEKKMEKVYEIYIRTTPERLWHAITDPDEQARWQFGNRANSDWAVGSHFEYTNPKAPGMVLGDGEILESDPPRRLVQTMQAHWDADVEAEGVTRVTWEITPVGDQRARIAATKERAPEPVESTCRLVVTHDQMRDGANSQIYGGWPMMLSGLKTWIEVGDVLTTPGSLMYA